MPRTTRKGRVTPRKRQVPSSRMYCTKTPVYGDNGRKSSTSGFLTGSCLPTRQLLQQKTRRKTFCHRCLTRFCNCSLSRLSSDDPSVGIKPKVFTYFIVEPHRSSIHHPSEGRSRYTSVFRLLRVFTRRRTSETLFPFAF